ncbi:MAG: YfhO family protein, partial [Bacteroidales bacterium]|nr:YfhO family protein [Bacteroidales bacterium]
NLMFVNEFLFYHLPLYSKFRTPAMALVMVTTLMALLAVLTLKQIFSDPQPERYKKPLWYSAGITGGFCLLCALFCPSLCSFISPNDAALSGQWPADAIESLRQTRIALLKADAWRSCLLIAIGACLIGCYIAKKLKATPTLLIMAAVILLDLWTIDRRYLNDGHFQKKQSAEIYPSDVDLAILQDPDLNYRVFNASTNTFNESMTSYFHKSIGGYSPAKLRRYQDIIDYHLSRRINPKVLNMLNAKYFIVPSQAGGGVQLNEAALGNAWFVDDWQWVETPNAEIEALYTFEPAQTAVVHDEFRALLPAEAAGRDTTEADRSIRLTAYKPNYLAYHSENAHDGLAVFSEIYYPKEWTAYIDGEEVPHFRVNYVLRALWIPAGVHEIEFRHTPYHFALWRNVANIGSLLVCLMVAGVIAGYVIAHKKRQNRPQA